MTAENLIFILYKYFDVNNNIDLAEKMGITKQTITNWKTRNSINAIKKKCYELGIYDSIFTETNFSGSVNTINDFGTLIDNSNNKLLNSSQNYDIPENVLTELSILFSRVNDEESKKQLSYKIEDFLIELKRKMRD